MGVDRFGLGWRSELAASILGALDRIDIVEVIADDWFAASGAKLGALRTLSAQTIVTLHGVGLGLASTQPVDERRLRRLARVVGHVRPAYWSEHLAFVRAGGIEIGHLAAPPRDDATLEGTFRNVERARRVAGAPPLLENVASLIDPPGSMYDEAAWLQRVARASGLLLDLHNLHANARNFGFDAHAVVRTLPPSSIRCIHLAGGHALRNGLWLDDHMHAVPDPVYALLETAAQHTSGVDHSIDVIIERDGRYPSFEDLLRELDAAREAWTRGRLSPAQHGVSIAEAA